MIKEHEGTRYSPYQDTLGLWTVGVGHLIGNGKTLPPEMNREFSQAEVDTMFDEDYEKHAAAARGIPGYSILGPAAQGALEDLTFNMGPRWYKKWPTFTKQLAAGDTTGAANNLQSSKWYGQVGPWRGNKIISLIGNDPGKGGDASSASPIPSSDRQTSLGESETPTASAAAPVGGPPSSAGGSSSSAGGSLSASNMGAAGTGSPSAPSPQAGPAAATRNAGAVSAGTAGLASAGAAAPMIVANNGGPPAPAAPSVTMMMPIPIPIRPRTEDMVLRAIPSVNYI
jgi:GH24 family phage-related lysozyme (muramidase)